MTHVARPAMTTAASRANEPEPVAEPQPGGLEGPKQPASKCKAAAVDLERGVAVRFGEMSRTFTQRIHNPRDRECACDPDCWCQRTSIGRAVKWWFPARFFGLHHKNSAAEWKRQQTGEALADWKRRNDPDRPQPG